MLIIAGGLSFVSLIIGIGLRKDFFYFLSASLLLLAIFFLWLIMQFLI